MPTYKGDEVYYYDDGTGRYMYRVNEIPEISFHDDYIAPHSTITLKATTNITPDDWGSILDWRPKIEKVIFNPPATIVLWSDGTKTVVKCQEGDEWDAEKGLAMAISKKWFYNKGRFNDEFEKWVAPQLEIEAEIGAMPIQAFLHDIVEAFKQNKE